jgi:hypothetical protein
MPVPDSAIVCGVPGALSEIMTDEARGPVVAGAKVTLMLHEPAAARLPPQLSVSAKSPVLPPETAIELIASVAPPIFFSVTDWGLLVTPVWTLPKLILLLLRLTNG